MKNTRALVMMALAVLFGLGAVALAARWLLNQPGAAAGKIVVAATDVSLGQTLTPDMVKLVEWPIESLPKGALTNPLAATNRVLKDSVVRGEPLTEAKLAPSGSLGGLSALIGAGKRAITVRVNDVIGVAGFALPGNLVDIIVHTQRDPSGHESTGREHPISKIVLERILVLAVAQEVSRDDAKPRVVNAVTLEVTPEQAENLDLARSVGTLSLVLRNQLDREPAATTGATKQTLLDETAPAPEPASPVQRAVAPTRPAPVRAARVQSVALPTARACSGVIEGLHTSQECF